MRRKGRGIAAALIAGALSGCAVEPTVPIASSASSLVAAGGRASAADLPRCGSLPSQRAPLYAEDLGDGWLVLHARYEEGYRPICTSPIGEALEWLESSRSRIGLGLPLLDGSQSSSNPMPIKGGSPAESNPMPIKGGDPAESNPMPIKGG